MDILKNVDFDEAISKKMLEVGLHNALKYKGKANPGTVISGTLGFFPELKSDMKRLAMNANKLVKEINSLDEQSQTNMLLELDPNAFEKEEKSIFDFLKIKEGEKVITAFPPGPEKHPHIGHAKALLLNYELAKKYGGEFILRFEDTNPKLVKKEYYEIMREYFSWLGVKTSKIINASDYMELYYECCEKLIKSGDAYVCDASAEYIKLSRDKGVPTKGRSRSVDENLKLWEEMKTSMPENTAIVRLKIDLEHKNSTMRDPTIFRVILSPHAIHKSKYRVYPNYDFQNSIMDGHFNITHRLRSKEFEMRNELQRYIQNLLGFKQTNIFEFARFTIKGVETSGRKIREKIEANELIGWDDPSLVTLSALKRRGFMPGAIKEFVLNTGITKNEAVLSFDDLVLQNRRLLDGKTKKAFFVNDPVLIKVNNAKEIHVNLSSENQKNRIMNINQEIFISKEDFNKLKTGNVYRLIEAYNIKYLGKNTFEYLDDSVDTFKEKGDFMFHYVPKEDYKEISVLMPNKKLVKGYLENQAIKVDEIVNFERFGFCKKDADNTFWFTH
ncbi:MAG: glutamate--tRNA ligase [Candidatus Woesearchaeota archaeon]